MDKQVFLNQLKLQFVDNETISLDFKDDIRKNDSYDSLTGMAILVMIKDEYGVDISELDFKNQKSIADLYLLVESQIKD
jgi:acyl carrier protein